MSQVCLNVILLSPVMMNTLNPHVPKVFIITGESSETFRQTWDTGFKVFIITGESSETFRQTWDMRV
jgi:hypothetical protein